MKIKIEKEKQNATKFARALIKHFGRVQSKEILNFLLENKNASNDIALIASLALNYMEPNQKEH